MRSQFQIEPLRCSAVDSEFLESKSATCVARKGEERRRAVAQSWDNLLYAQFGDHSDVLSTRILR